MYAVFALTRKAAQFSCEKEAYKTEKEITSNSIITVQHRRAADAPKGKKRSWLADFCLHSIKAAGAGHSSNALIWCFPAVCAGNVGRTGLVAHCDSKANCSVLLMVERCWAFPFNYPPVILCKL